MTIDLAAISSRARLVPYLSLMLAVFAAVCWGCLAVGDPSRPIVTACPAPEPGMSIVGGRVFTSDGEDAQPPGVWVRKRPGGLLYDEVPIDPPAIIYYLRGEERRYELRCSYGRDAFDMRVKLILPIPGLPMRCEELFYEVDMVRPDDGSPFRDVRWISYACESEPLLPFDQLPARMRS